MKGRLKMTFKMNTFYNIVNQNSGKLASVNDASLNDGEKLTQYHSTEKPAQQWMLYLLDNNNYVVINRNSGKVQSVNDASLSDGATINQYHWTGNSPEQWQFDLLEDNIFKILNSNSGKVQSVNDASLSDGANITQYDWNGNPPEQWKVIEAENAEFSLPIVTIESLPEVPQYENANQSLPNTTPVITAYTLIPCVMISDTWSDSDKVNNTPYYMLYKKQYWKNIDSHTFAPNTQYMSETKYGMNQTNQESMTQTTSISVTADAGFSFGKMSSSISTTVTDELQVSKSTTTELMTEQTNTETIENPNNYEVSWTKFALVTEYYLARADGTVIGDSPWVVIDKNQERESYYPLDTPPLPVTADKSKAVN